MDRRVVTAILLMMAVAIVPSFFYKPKPAARPAAAAADTNVRVAPVAPPPTLSAAPGAAAQPMDSTVALPEDTVLVRSPLAAYGISTKGARLVRAEITRYPDLGAGANGAPADLVRAGGLFGAKLVAGRDTMDLASWDFVADTTRLDAATAPSTVRFRSSRGPIGVEIAYTVQPDDYRLDVQGTVTGLGPEGGSLLLSLGDGIRETEKDTVENARAAGLVTKIPGQDAERHDFSSLKPGEAKLVEGQFEWLAVKSKYFVAAVFAFDSTRGRLGGARYAAAPGVAPVRYAQTVTSLPVRGDGRFAFGAYVGPMEYQRLAAIGNDFDDVNPYGWPGFRGMIRFFSAPVRWLLIRMHDIAGIPWGVALILFGILVRLLLWPFNQKAMKSSMEMQAVQPLLQEIQAKYKNDPQKLSQKQMELFKEHKVNPLGGCLPTLLPWPVMLALFFVFQNTIELRGAPFLWLPDLSLKDPLYIIPVLMGASMWAMMKVGQIGMPPNDQTKLMSWMMPVMMTVMFANFASGLNLYYTVQNLVGIPQQWLLLQERKKRGLVQPPAAPKKK
jgi:YidC/Oxa1 family membrane protein insertase